MNRTEAVSHAREYGVHRLLDIHNPKTRKGEKHGWLTAILHLAPSDVSGVMNVCPYASPGCRAACLNTAGRGKTQPIQDSRIRKTVFLKQQREAFLLLLHRDVEAAQRKADRMGLKLAVRLNGTSDIAWERIAKLLFESFPDVQFYDYTKSTVRMRKSYKLPANYDLTFSRSENNDKDVERILRNGGRVAVVFEAPPPATWNGYKVVSGDKTDLRFLDKQGVVVALLAKGKARKDESGFVVKHPRLFPDSTRVTVSVKAAKSAVKN